MKLPRDRFPIQRINRAEGNNRGRALRITCGCGCGQTEDFTITTETQPPPEAAAKYFERKGWRVGKRPHHDRSPACVAAEEERRKAEREAKREERQMAEIKMPSPIEQAIAADEQCNQSSPDGKHRLAAAEEEKMHADPPRTMTRPDRRRIFDAIDAEYPEFERGYRSGMTDEILAVRLNVPRAWVSSVREESFGPEFVIDWTVVDRKREAIRKMIKEAEERFFEGLAAAEKAANDLDREVEALKKRVGQC